MDPVELEVKLTELLAGLDDVAADYTGTRDPRDAEDLAVVRRRLRGMLARVVAARREPAAAA